MSTDTGHHDVHHPTPKEYVKIAVILAILTAFEVALFYIEDGVDAVGQGLTAPLLLILSAMKFVIVVGWFMHLRFEDRFLSRFFSIGAVLALALYFIVLAVMGAVALF